MTDTPAHLEPLWSDRGLKIMIEVLGTYGGSAKVYESSAASAPYVWLRVVDSDDEATVHLTLEDAAKLRDQLDYLVKNHYQLEGKREEVDDGKDPVA